MAGIGRVRVTGDKLMDDATRDAQGIKDNELWGTRSWFESRFIEQDPGPGSYYGHALNGYQRYRHKKIVDELGVSPKTCEASVILDMGCALGDLGRRVAQLCPDTLVVGFDFVPAVVRQAATLNPDLCFAAAALPNIPFKEATFDLVLASEVIYYLARPKRHEALEEICNVIKANGKLLFTSVLDDGIWYFSRSEAIDFVKDHVEIERIVYDHNLAYHRLNRQVMRLLNLRRWFENKTQVQVARHKYTPLWALLSWIEKTPPLKTLAVFVLKVVGYIAVRLLTCEWLPAIMSSGSKKVWGDRAITNIVIVGKKAEREG